MLSRRQMLGSLAAQVSSPAPVYVMLWFDTEDYIEPAADDAALRLARDLTQLGVRATFKMVGEKARVLEQRRRNDVIAALSRHDIGYHTDFHSVQPVPAVYLEQMGWLEGAEEFRRREEPGLRDLLRIFRLKKASCYGQPGSSWGPQAYRALRQMGIDVYLDEGSHVGVRNQPFWFAGMLNVFYIGPYAIRAGLNAGDRFEDFARSFDDRHARLQQQGGGLISIYYHPTEFVTTEFWDGVNFSKGETRERSQWKKPNPRTKADSERTYDVHRRLVSYAKAKPGVEFITASDLARVYRPADDPLISREQAARHLASRITYYESPQAVLSAGELLAIVMGAKTRPLEGPVERTESTVRDAMPRWLFEQGRREAIAYLEQTSRLPSRVWIGPRHLSLADFAATLAQDNGAGNTVTLRQGDLTTLEAHVGQDPRRLYGWAIHPDGFEGGHLLDLARLQCWTLKPARLIQSRG